MPFLATEHVSIPNQDLISWIYDNPKFDIDEPVYIDAADPNRTINHRDALDLVKRLAAGFRKAGLQKGDVVCMHAFNDVFPTPTRLDEGTPAHVYPRYTTPWPSKAS